MTHSSSRSVRLPSSLGIRPDNRFLATLTTLSLLKLPRVAGSVPSKRFSANLLHDQRQHGLLRKMNATSHLTHLGSQTPGKLQADVHGFKGVQHLYLLWNVARDPIISEVSSHAHQRGMQAHRSMKEGSVMKRCKLKEAAQKSRMCTKNKAKKCKRFTKQTGTYMLRILLLHDSCPIELGIEPWMRVWPSLNGRAISHCSFASGHSSEQS